MRIPKRYDVAIVGAGASGLTAARDLCRAGASVVLLEARSRIGGRIWTLSRAGWETPVELGAEFVHGRKQTVFEEAAAARLPLVRLPDTHAESTRSGWRTSPDTWERFDRIARTIPARGKDISVRDFLRARRLSLSAADRRLFRSLVEGYDAAPISSASARALARSGQPDAEDARAQFRLVAGYGALAEALASGIDASRRCRTVLSTVIQTIAWSNEGVRLRAAHEEFHARRALITIPVGVLSAATGARGAITFDPDPPQLREALAGLAMGQAVRLVLRFRDAFWRPLLRDSSGRAFGREPVFLHLPRGAAFPTWWTPAPIEAPVLTAWAGGPAAQRLLRLRPEATLQRALHDLAGALAVSRASVSRRLIDWQCHDWSADPFSRGAYSYVRVGGSSAGQALARAVAGTLFFAGEACGLGETGTVAAAIESGRRAAAHLGR